MSAAVTLALADADAARIQTGFGRTDAAFVLVESFDEAFADSRVSNVLPPPSTSASTSTDRTDLRMTFSRFARSVNSTNERCVLRAITSNALGYVARKAEGVRACVRKRLRTEHEQENRRH